MMNSLLVLLMPSFSTTPPVAAQDDMPRASQFWKQKNIILQKLSSSSPDERIQAVSIAREERFRESAPQLIQLLRDDNPAVRAEAAYAIGVLRIRNAGVRLYQLMINDPSPLVRSNAMVALAELDYKGALAVILNSLDRPDIREQMAAIKALGKFGGAKAFNQLIRILRTGNPDLRESVIDALGELGDQQVARYLFRYLDQGGSRINRAALMALTRLVPHQVQNRLPRLLESRDPEMVRTALLCAADAGCPECGPAIMRLIQTAPDPLAALAADTAAFLNMRETADAIYARLHPRPNIQTRISLLWALGRMEFAGVLPEVLDALREPVPELRVTALRILRILRPEGLRVEALVEPLLRDAHESVAAEAIRLLSEFGSHKWMEGGLPAESDEPRLTAALEALAWVHPFPDEYLPRIREWTQSKKTAIRDAAIHLLGIQRKKEFTQDLARVADPEDRVRWSSVRALAFVRNPETRGILESVARSDSLPVVRAYAVLGACAIPPAPSSQCLRMAEQAFDAAFTGGEYGMAYIYAMALLYAPDGRHADAFDKIFKALLMGGFNSSRKSEYVDLLFLMAPPGADRWMSQLLASPVPRVRSRAMVWKAQYAKIPGGLPLPEEKSQEKASPASEPPIRPPFRVEDSRGGCSCRAGHSPGMGHAAGWTLFLLFWAYALRRRARTR